MILISEKDRHMTFTTLANQCKVLCDIFHTLVLTTSSYGHAI